MDVITEVEPVDVRFQVDDIESLQIPVTVGQRHGNTKFPGSRFQFLDERHVVRKIIRTASSIAGYGV